MTNKLTRLEVANELNKMRKISASSKQGQHYINNFKNSDNYKLYDCYNNYSQAKQDAFEWCVNRCNELDGRNYKIISYCINNFVFAFFVGVDLVIETKSNEYVIKGVGYNY